MLLLLLHLGPLVPLFLALPASVAAPLALLSLVSLWQTWQRFVRRAAGSSVVGIRLSGEREWFLEQGDGRIVKAELIRSFVQRWLTLLLFETRRGRCRVVILPDTAEVNGYHRLRVFLDHMR